MIFLPEGLVEWVVIGIITVVCPSLSFNTAFLITVSSSSILYPLYSDRAALGLVFIYLFVFKGSFCLLPTLLQPFPLCCGSE